MQFAQKSLQTILSAIPLSTKASIGIWENMGRELLFLIWILLRIDCGVYGVHHWWGQNLRSTFALLNQYSDFYLLILFWIKPTHSQLLLLLDDNCIFQMFLWLRPISTCMYIHEGLNISCLGSSCIKDTMNRNVENVVHFHLLLMSFTLFFYPDTILFFVDFFQSPVFALARPGLTPCYVSAQFLLLFNSVSAPHLFCTWAISLSYLLSRTKKERILFCEKIYLKYLEYEHVHDRNKDCFLGFHTQHELCYNINSSLN